MSKIINVEEENKKQKAEQDQAEFLRGLAGLGARSSGSLDMPYNFNKPSESTEADPISQSES